MDAPAAEMTRPLGRANGACSHPRRKPVGAMLTGERSPPRNAHTLVRPA
jgi:hypothetical protein